MYGLLRPALFQMDPERAHKAAVAALGTLHRSSSLQKAVARKPDPRLAVRAMDLSFPSPLGVAAGFDKEAHAYNALLALGFGHVEVGTVTPRSQPGNDKPRMQRHPGHKAVVNRLGFPGPGAEEIGFRIRSHPPTGLIGINIGPNKTTAAEDVPADLRACTEELADEAAYLAINVSSPNTPGLRALQTPQGAAKLVSTVCDELERLGCPKPVLLKLHPDAPHDELVDVAKAAVEAGAQGIIATNTTRGRPAGLEGAMEGGLSGAPLLEKSRACIAALYRGLGGDVPIIGVGGVFTGADALGHIRAGASLVQVYTGFIYRGPRTARHIQDEMLQAMDAARVDQLSDLVGTSA